MISWDVDLTGFYKGLVVIVATLAMIWARDPVVVGMWLFGVYYCLESHYYYKYGYKPYGKLGGAMKRAINR